MFGLSFAQIVMEWEVLEEVLVVVGAAAGSYPLENRLPEAAKNQEHHPESLFVAAAGIAEDADQEIRSAAEQGLLHRNSVAAGIEAVVETGAAAAAVVVAGTGLVVGTGLAVGTVDYCRDIRSA